MRRHERHPFLDAMVFGLALLLALIVGYYAVRRFLPASEATGEAARLPRPAEAVSSPVSRREIKGSGTEQAVSALPPARGASVPKRRRKNPEIPSPR